MKTLKKYAFFWIMLGIFIFSISIHWITAWNSFVREQNSTDVNTYLNEVIRQTFENIQSETLQLLLQVVLLAYFWYAGSTQSKEGNTRLEEKIDFIMHQLNPEQAERVKTKLEKQYPKK